MKRCELLAWLISKLHTNHTNSRTKRDVRNLQKIWESSLHLGHQDILKIIHSSFPTFLSPTFQFSLDALGVVQVGLGWS